MKQCETHFKDIFSKNDKNLKNIALAGNFNINLKQIKNVQVFLNLMFCYNRIPLINKPTQVTIHSVNAIDRIITNSITSHNDFKSPIIKTDLSDHFSIFFALIFPMKQPKNQ